MDERIIRAKLEHIKRAVDARRWPIEGWEARTADHLAPGEYRFDGDWQPVAVGASWPATKTLFLRAQTELPAGMPPEELVLSFDMVGLEGLLSVNGRPYAGLDPNHMRVPAPAADRLELEAEFTCWGAALHRPELRRERAFLRDAALVQVDREVEAAFYDLSFVWEASQHAPDARRRDLLHAALEEALLAVDLTAPRERFTADLAAARRGLQARLAAIAPDPEGGRVFLTGHSHIDVAWLWPLRETVRKCGRTFSTACRLMEQYPDYHFACSQPQLYAYTREHYPTLYAEMRRWIEQGRWECTGGMWVESDCNVSSGEALIRQVLYGLAFFRDEFGARPRTCWLPDVFGYPASLPGILKGCGLENFMTCKLHWQSRNPFPAHLFWWEGIDGSRVLAHIPRLKSYYNGRPTPEELRFAWEHYHQKAAYPEVLFPFGFGDGGGGPTPEMLEYAARAADCPGVPAARQGSEEAYFDDVRASAPELPLWVGELYLETHRGTYTTHAEIKRANRQNELLLREAEIMGLLAQAHGADLDLAALQPAWANLLLLQFHDILPGSSIGEVYREAAEDHARIAAAARGVRDQALQSLASRVGAPGDLIVFNSLSWARADAALAALPAGADASGPLELVAPDGSRTPGQVVVGSEGEARLLFAAEAAPAVGYAVFGIQHAAAAPAHSLAVSERSLENRFFALELDDEGAIRRLFDKRHGREVVSSDQPANDLQLFQDGPEREAAWNIHDTFERRAYDWEPGAQIEVIERGPVRAGVRVVKRYRQSRLEQDILLYDRVPRIDFVTRVDWRERQVLLKAAFPFDIHATNATFEIQFGAVERPTHRNTSWEQAKFEVAGHRWADLSEAGYGVSVLNDCKYGYDVHGSVLRLTLLRGTELPDPEADMGAHAFTYALLPHGGDWRDGETVRRAWELNVPLVGLPATPGQGDLPGAASFIQVAGPAVLETVKPAENDDSWIVRLYEPHGGRGQVRVRMPRRLQSVVICNHVEEDETALLVEGDSFTFDLRPYQVRTFRVRME